MYLCSRNSAPTTVVVSILFTARIQKALMCSTDPHPTGVHSIHAKPVASLSSEDLSVIAPRLVTASASNLCRRPRPGCALHGRVCSPPADIWLFPSFQDRVISPIPALRVPLNNPAALLSSRKQKPEQLLMSLKMSVVVAAGVRGRDFRVWHVIVGTLQFCSLLHSSIEQVVTS